MEKKRRKKKRIRNVVCCLYCLLELVLVLLMFWGMKCGLKHLLAEEVEEAVIVIDAKCEAENETGILVCIDAGHGGKDDGSDYKKRLEKDDNLKMAKALQAYLESQNIRVLMTRESDEFLSLAKRCEIANKAKADYFVSLHRNKGDGYGVETWVYSNASEDTIALAEGIMAGLDTAGIQRNRGVRKGTQKSENRNYYVNTHTDMPACILELGFINNTKDNSLLDEKIETYAAAIGNAVIEMTQKSE